MHKHLHIYGAYFHLTSRMMKCRNVAFKCTQTVYANNVLRKGDPESNITSEKEYKW